MLLERFSCIETKKFCEQQNYAYDSDICSQFSHFLLDQVVVGSFLPGHQLEHKNKKQRVEHVHISTVNPSPVNIISSEELKVSFGGVKPIMTPAAFQEENIVSFNNGQDSRNSSPDDKDPLPDKESNLSQSNAEAAAC